MFVEQKKLSMAKNCYRIHNAAYFADTDLLRTLLTDKHYANCRNEKGNTPLASTLLGKKNTKVKLKVLELLIQNGAEVNYVNDESDSILHVAVRTAFHQKISTKIIKWLIDRGADKTLANKQNLTASQLAFHVSNSKLGTYLLFYDAPREVAVKKSAFDNRLVYSKPIRNRAATSYTKTISHRRAKSPGVVRNLIDLMYPLCVSKYPHEEIAEADKPLPINRKPNERKRTRRYYEDIDISSDENLASHDELFRNGYENIFEQLHLNRNIEGNFILQLNDGSSSSDISRAVVLATSSDDSSEFNGNDRNCSDT